MPSEKKYSKFIVTSVLVNGKTDTRTISATDTYNAIKKTQNRMDVDKIISVTKENSVTEISS